MKKHTSIMVVSVNTNAVLGQSYNGLVIRQTQSMGIHCGIDMRTIQMTSNVNRHNLFPDLITIISTTSYQRL